MYVYMCMYLHVQGLSVPVEGVLVEAQLQLAATLLQVYEEHVLEDSERRSRQQQKSCIEKVGEETILS